MRSIFWGDGTRHDTLPRPVASGLVAADFFRIKRIEALSMKLEGPVAAERFQSFLERLTPNVFRGKGVLCVEGSDKRLLFHLGKH
jgi:G3E family GTPase